MLDLDFLDCIFVGLFAIPSWSIRHHVKSLQPNRGGTTKADYLGTLCTAERGIVAIGEGAGIDTS
jgi:hypothetical protein